MQSRFPLSTLLASVASAVVVAACSAPVAPTTVPAAVATVAPTAAAAPKPAEPTKVPALPTAPPAPAGKSNVTVYVDGDTNITDWYANVLAPEFEKANPQYKVVFVNLKGVGAGMQAVVDRVLAAKQTNSDPQADVLETAVTGYPDALKADAFLKLDSNNVPNSANAIKAAFVSPFNVPYRGSQVLLAYDSAKIKDADVPRTFPALIEWTKKNPGQFTYGRPDKGGSGGNFVVRAIHEVTGKDPSIFKAGDPDPALVKQFDKAWELLRSMHEFTYDKGSYPAGNQPALQLLANGSVSMVSAWSDQVLQGVEKGVLPPTIKMAQLTDLPLAGGYSQYAIPKNSANQAGALAFVNWMLTSDRQVDVVKRIGGFPAVAWDKLPKELQQQFNSVITDNVPTWPGGKWDAERNKGWYEKVATNIKQ